MGYRGKLIEQEGARHLRALAWSIDEIAGELGVAKSSVSLRVRDVDFEPKPRRKARRRGPNVLQRKKAQQIEELRLAGTTRLGSLGEQAFLSAGVALYAGEGTKRGTSVDFANSDPRLIGFFCRWLRHFFVIDESRLRVRLYLHEGLDLEEAQRYGPESPVCRSANSRRAIVPWRMRASALRSTNTDVRLCVTPARTPSEPSWA